jgi:serine/threonine-protein kinase
MPSDPTCPRCGASRPANGLEGVCPRCLLRLGLGDDLSAGPAATLSFVGLREPDAEQARARISGVLEGLAESVGPVPRVLLRDGPGGDSPRPVRPRSEEMPRLAGEGGRYQLLGEIARGGMGVVLKGRDVDLGRDLAVKVLLEKHRDHPEMVRRFVEEAQIGGQLQHPGIVPVYELGQFPDQRLYIAMKLVGGRTLAALLEARESPADDRSRFLSIFEQVCQTMAYAHSRGVIHRDLKPSNVMVGGFGEVQVMDWGLAKVLDQGGAVDDSRPLRVRDTEETITTLRSGSDAGESRAGSVMGTPAYMAPEQARGALDTVDERADVFGLGSMLCEILTGEPAYTGRSGTELYQKAQRAELSDALARLDAHGLEPELVDLARACLAPAPKDRPREAGVVATALTRHLEGVQRRLREAELAQAGAEARASEERRRRMLSVGLAATVLASTVLGAVGWTWTARERASRFASTTRAVNEAIDEAMALRFQAESTPRGAEARWAEALETARRAEALLARGESGDDLRDRVARLKASILLDRDKAAAAEKDRRIIERLAEIHADFGVHTDRARTDLEYAQAFTDYGLKVDEVSVEEAGDWIASRRGAVKLAAALDQWTFTRRKLEPPDHEGAAHLTAIAERADPDPWRNQLRDALERQVSDRPRALAELRRLAESADVDGLPSASVERLAAALADLGEDDTAVSLFRRAQLAHPDDFWINSYLGADLLRTGKRLEAIRYFSVAVAVRPASGPAHLNLGSALHLDGRLDDALATFKKAAQLRPDATSAPVNLGAVLLDLDQGEAARQALRDAEQLQPDDRGLREDLADVLIGRGEWLAGVAELREAVRLASDNPFAHDHLGMALSLLGRTDEAIVELAEAARLAPDFGPIRSNLGRALMASGNLTGALSAFRVGLDFGSLESRRRSPSGDAAREIERMVALEPRRLAVVEGKDRPVDLDETIAFARLCGIRGQHATAARLWLDAFARQPSLLDEARSGPRWQAARSAALAAEGRGSGEPAIDESARPAWRKQALAWLQADLAVMARWPDEGRSRTRLILPARVGLWKLDPALASLRDPSALAGLPEAERSQFRAFWTEAEDRARQVRSSGKLGGPRNVSRRLLDLNGGGGEGEPNRNRRGGPPPPRREVGRPGPRERGRPDEHQPPGDATKRRPPPDDGPRDPFESRKPQ